MNYFVILCSCFVVCIVFSLADSLECGTRLVIQQQAMGKRIIGGTEAMVGSWPWMVMLTSNDEYKCGGTIIAHRFILTAAHCLYGQNPAQLKVIVGKHHKNTVDDTEQAFSVESFKIHGLYNNSTLVHDIALIKLQESITYSELAQPACLPNKTITFNEPCYTTGWGETKGTGHADVLKQVVPPVNPKHICIPYLRRISPIMPGRNFCLGTTKADACFGDSGGPHNCEYDGRWYVTGVVSFGKDCAQPMHPGIYVNVAKYKAWIETIMKSMTIT